MIKAKITKADETPEFREFWAMWRPVSRQTDGRGLAREAFFKHVRAGADPRDIVDGARWFLRSLTNPEYIPLSATWLNRCAYEDMAEQEREYQRRKAEKQAAQSNVVSIRPQQPYKTAFMREWERMHAEKQSASRGNG